MNDHNYYNLDAEQAILGAIFMEPELIKDCRLQPNQVSPGRHFNILYTMKDMDSKGIPIDFVTMVERVGNEKVGALGGISYLSEIANGVPTTANFKNYEDIILEGWQRREMIRVAQKAQSYAMEMDPMDAVQSAIQDLLKIEDNDADDENGDYEDELLEMFDDLESGPKGINGIRSGFRDLDNMTAGFQETDLIIIGARPSVGKTAFALNVSNNAAAGPNNPHGDVVAIFSMEMKKKLLLRRMASSLANIDAQILRTGNLSNEDWRKLSMAMGTLSNMDLKIFDRSGIDVQYIGKKLRALKRRYPGRRILVMIDYLQLIQGDKVHRGNRQAEVSEISRQLKIMAGDLKVCIIALSQLSRGLEQRQDKRPMMSDLRESGSIEQDADIVGFLFREDYYDKETENQNIIEIILAKQRNGPIGTIPLAFIKEFGKFVNIDYSQHRPPN